MKMMSKFLDKSYSFRNMDGNRYVVSIENHAEIVSSLTEFCNEIGIRSGSICGIGAIDRMTLRFFDPATKEYVDKEFTEQMEIANLTGNISTLDGEEYLHLHIVAGRRDYSAVAGHLLSAYLSGAGEFVVEDFGAEVKRVHSPELGLNVYKF